MRVAVFGAGYAGLTVARRLERWLPEAVDIVVVDESPSHLLQHELHRVIRYPNLAETLTVPLEDVLTRATIRRARVTGIDPEAGVATLETNGETEPLEYDFAAVCLGAETAFYDLPGVEEHATPLKRLNHAETIRSDAFDSVGGHGVVGGAGLSGVQVAGELAALSESEDLDLDVTVVEMADRVAPSFDEPFAHAVRQELDARGIAVETGATVERADEDGIDLADGRTLAADLLVWTGGIRGPDALDGERRPVNADLAVGDNTFVVGDAGAVTDEWGKAVPASAQTAVREARIAAKNIDRHVRERRDDEPPRLATYSFDSPGWVVSVGDGAVAQIGPVICSGDPAKAAKAAIGAGHLSSIGAIERASELVHEELGWPDASAFDFSAELARLVERYEFTANTDPATPSELEVPFLDTTLAFAETMVPGGTVDVTRATRLADRSYPGSPANIFEDAVFGALGGMFGSRRSKDDEE
ncbi:MAG: NAD(P)/FAD-dependent oxidoreductase [Natronomonas sp.]